MRGRQYYDPIVQVPGKVEGAQDLSRIELYPEGAPDDPNPKWKARRVNADGAAVERTAGDFDHDRALQQAQSMWPALTVYELRSEGEDSTWEGHGPSPRLWQQVGTAPHENPGLTGPVPLLPPAVEETVEVPARDEGWEGSDADYFAHQAPLRLLAAPEPGAYVLLADILNLLELWAVSYEVDKNPSGALALREAADALKDIG